MPCTVYSCQVMAATPADRRRRDRPRLSKPAVVEPGARAGRPGRGGRPDHPAAGERTGCHADGAVLALPQQRRDAGARWPSHIWSEVGGRRSVGAVAGPAPGHHGVTGRHAARASVRGAAACLPRKGERGSMQAAEIALGLLRGAGFDPSRPARSPERYVDRDDAGDERAGLRARRQGGSGRRPSGPSCSAASRSQMAMLPARKYPHLVECAAAITRWTPIFTTGSDRPLHRGGQGDGRRISGASGRLWPRSRLARAQLQRRWPRRGAAVSAGQRA